MKQDRFHGRVEGVLRACETPGCEAAGDFRAPGTRPAGFDGPGEWRWLCLDHVREFNARYDWFAGMDSDEILRAQSPIAGWETDIRAFRPDAGIDQAPRWADFADPLEAINARAKSFRRSAHADMAERAAATPVTPAERRALEALGLSRDTTRQAIRQRYSELVRRYHPDRNGGDRRYEERLRGVVEAYQLLKKAAAFA